jgi:hypothetical protein
VQVEPGYLLKMVNPNSTTGSIRYTTNGQDPRNIGGGVNTSGIMGDDETEISINTTTVIKARILNGSTWSALHQLILFTNDNAADLKITEIHYHPVNQDTTSDNEYEFLELKNIGTTPIDLSLTYFAAGITYVFPLGTIIEPDHFIVLASNRDEFNSRYSLMPDGEYSGQLDNGGEWLILCAAAGDTIFAVQYNDIAPWPTAPDGSGYSLVPTETDPQGELNDPVNWRSSYAMHGSPGRDDTPDTSVNPPPPYVPESFALDQNFPNPFNPGTTIHFTTMTGGDVRLTVYDLLGREVAVLVNGVLDGGDHRVTFTAMDLSSGIYFYILQSPDGVITKKMVLLR